MPPHTGGSSTVKVESSAKVTEWVDLVEPAATLGDPPGGGRFAEV